MADNDANDNGRRPPRGRPHDRGASAPRGKRPFRKDGPKGAAFASREPGGNGPRKPREAGDRPFRKPRPEGERPFRKSRPEGDRPFGKPRGDGAGGFRKNSDRPQGEGPRLMREETIPAIVPELTEERIAKVIARAGIASRRDAEAMIADGRVTLNGEVLASPAINVGPGDKITVDGEPLPARERTRLWIFHKPRGLVTTARDPQGRPTVFESLPEDLPRVVAVGRLDINTEGLLLLTNDGGLARVIAHPNTGWLRRYRVRAHGEITQEQLDTLQHGISLDGVDYGPIEARLDRIQGDNAWITMGLREGKNREIKNILEHLGLDVNRLIRLSFGPFQLGDMEPGLVEEVRTKVLREQLGQTLADEAGVDFESPVREPIAPFGSPQRQERGSVNKRERGAGLDRGRDEDRRHRDRGDERPFRKRDERPPRGRRDDEAPRGRRDDETPRERPVHGAERRPSVWRAKDEAGSHRVKAPRRGADPKAARAASGERKHQRVGAIEAGEGRRVVVERLVSEPRLDGERPARRPRKDNARPPPRGDDRPRRREKADFGEHPGGGRKRGGAGPDGAREGPFRGGSRDERPHRAGGFGKGPRRAGPGRSAPPRGGPRGSKGPPRDRRS